MPGSLLAARAGESSSAFTRARARRMFNDARKHPDTRYSYLAVKRRTSNHAIRYLDRSEEAGRVGGVGGGDQYFVISVLSKVARGSARVHRAHGTISASTIFLKNSIAWRRYSSFSRAKSKYRVSVHRLANNTAPKQQWPPFFLRGFCARGSLIRHYEPRDLRSVCLRG